MQSFQLCNFITSAFCSGNSRELLRFPETGADAPGSCMGIHCRRGKCWLFVLNLLGGQPNFANCVFQIAANQSHRGRGNILRAGMFWAREYAAFLCQGMQLATLIY